jgi:hypothetical protein
MIHEFDGLQVRVIRDGEARTGELFRYVDRETRVRRISLYVRSG